MGVKMKKLIALKIIPLIVLGMSNSIFATEVADSVYLNGKIYTVNESQPWAQAMAVKGGKFLKVGSVAQIEDFIGDKTQIIDLGEKFIMPGVHDTHVHPGLAYVFKESGDLLFTESLSKKEIQNTLRKYANENPDRKALRGEKWSTSLFPDGKATKEFLDAVITDRPVMLYDETGHNSVANSKALQLAGITKDTAQPEGGKIDKDPITGEPTGYLSETAVGLMNQIFPKPDADAHYRGISMALMEMRAFGITSFNDMAAGANSLKAYKRLEDEGKLDYRVAASIPLDHFAGDIISASEANNLLRIRKKYDTHLINPNNIKYWSDGTPFSYTALLLEPYTNKPETRGEMTMFQSHWDRLPELDRQGLSMKFHTVGDGTTRKLLDAIESIRKGNPNNKTPHQFGHLMMVNADDIPRFKELNIIAEFSPALWYPTSLTETAKTYVGEERVKRWQPIKEFVDAGVIVSYGSDWPAGTPDADPWRALEAMVTRSDPNKQISGKIGEGIDVAMGIRILTMGGAYAMQQDKNVGSIEEGKFADFIILDRNLIEISSIEINKTRVLQTIFEGEVVYKD